jgi:hypothetical protein
MRHALFALCLVLPAPLAAQPPFTTSAEVRPILAMTKQAWVAVREYGGQDLVYFTHLAAWRCGIVAARYVLNDEPEAEFPLEPCYLDSPQPNAVRGEPWVARPLGSVQTLRVTVEYDDGSSDSIEVTRGDVLMP